MDETEVRSGSLGEKRPFEDVVGTDLANKKTRGDDEVRLVAEMVLVLAAMGKMRAGRRPAAVEFKMMAEAREKLAEICGGFAPRDVFPTDAFGTVIEDLGLIRVRETKSGIVPQKMSIAQKLQLTKQKMEKSEVFPLHSATYTPRVTEPCATPHAVQTVPSGKADHAPISSRSFQIHSSVVHASPTSNSRALPYQLPTSEVRPVGSNVLTSSHLGRGSTTPPIERAGRPRLGSDGRSNANSVGDHKASSFNKAGLNNGTHLANINHHMQHHTNFVQPPAANTHNEIAKIVQKILQPHIPVQHPWNPPSRDYMNKALTCQTCKSVINEVDTVLDYALFISTGNNLMPNKLQEMKEDKKTNKKWVTVTRCFFPDDLPDCVGRPCAPEGNEVYESNLETTLAAGLIHGPCKVLPPRKFSEERVIQTHSQTTTFDKPNRFFLCKWFYDEKKLVLQGSPFLGGYSLRYALLILRSDFKNVKQE
ncbi:hypothetical protein L1987_73998 [Smallanthus sonchifolius]|uniref:Uncharacterized protein n=1 Tax=Smallanthus sonchifolius TaxID=185202 RepID=A0ACB9A320_9ASTR|nr:hypothetical protein L1987_73998 [Smallanthus sonchifolius]